MSATHDFKLFGANLMGRLMVNPCVPAPPPTATFPPLSLPKTHFILFPKHNDNTVDKICFGSSHTNVWTGHKILKKKQTTTTTTTKHCLKRESLTWLGSKENTFWVAAKSTKMFCSCLIIIVTPRMWRFQVRVLLVTLRCRLSVRLSVLGRTPSPLETWLGNFKQLSFLEKKFIYLFILKNFFFTSKTIFPRSLFYAFLDVSCHPECSKNTFHPKIFFNELWVKQCYQAFYFFFFFFFFTSLPLKKARKSIGTPVVSQATRPLIYPPPIDQ